MSNTLKQFVNNLPTNCLGAFDRFMGLAILWCLVVFAGEARDRERTRQHMPNSIYVYENSYVQISITNIALYARKLSSQ